MGIRRMMSYATEEYDDDFVNLDGEQQDEILKAFEADEVEIEGMRSSAFFSLLRSTTIEGVYSDPTYGGNRNMEGWKMIQYPGPRMGWMDQITAEEFQEIEPEALRAYQGGGM